MTDSPRFNLQSPRDHGGGLDGAIERFGGTRADWIDLSTGINPTPYRIGSFPAEDWTALPDKAAKQRLLDAARAHWSVPDGAAILPAPGASVLIAMVPSLRPAGRVQITRPTYNEHQAAFASHGWEVCDTAPAEARVLVHPNNPDGRLWGAEDTTAPLTVIDESFGDVTPDHSLIELTTQPGRIILKSFGKFWGLAGLRLGFAIATPDIIAQMEARLGPWAVSGPALRIGARALEDTDWTHATRTSLQHESDRLDDLLTRNGAKLAGGTTLFRLYQVDDAADWQDRLARHRIWSRIFPYSDTYLRLGLPPAHGWERLERALA
ncbi:MAG: aminotransferase class I/II-fold pyridoxal phosphate-dependent enzyme [Rhodobacteraceae bacterium]|nr:aminotransferase class I/II-fold pyridoxal phosphate-dependent enzyme [Paracoccaceae bacterium]